MNKRLTALEVERILQESRDQRSFTGEVEKGVIKGIFETTKINGKIGDKYVAVVAPYQIHIPAWQRKLEIARAKEIGTSYDKNKWELPKVYYHRSSCRFFCADGMHRVFGAFLADKDKIVVEVMDVSEKQAINLFLNQTDNRRRMTPDDILGAAIAVGKPEYIKFKQICHKYNIQIKGDSTLANPIGTFTALSDGIRMAKNSPDVLDRVLELITNLGWYGNQCRGAYNAKMIRGMTKLFATHMGQEHVVNEALMKKCKGSEWYIDHLMDMPQYKIMDILMTQVNDYAGVN